MNAIIAVEAAIDAIRKTNPNGRDYYPQGPDAIHQAGREHAARMNHLEAIRRELEELCVSTLPKGTR